MKIQFINNEEEEYDEEYKEGNDDSYKDAKCFDGIINKILTLVYLLKKKTWV